MRRTRDTPAANGRPIGTVQSDLGRFDPPRVEDQKKPHGWEQRQIAAERYQTALLNEFQQIAAHLGDVLNLMRAPAPGDVLAQLQLVVPAAGVVARSFPAGYQAIAVANTGASTLTVSSQPPMTQAPSSGTGVATVAGGVFRVIPMHGTAVSIYGPPGATFDLIVYSRPRPASAGPAAQGLTSSVATPSGVLLPAGTTSSQSVQLQQISFTRLVVVLDVTAVAGSVQLVINAITSSGYSYPLLAPAAVAATGITPYRIGAALQPSVGAVANDVVPVTVQVVTTVTGTATYGVDYVGGK
jgi:hypothetical protein